VICLGQERKKPMLKGQGEGSCSWPHFGQGGTGTADTLLSLYVHGRAGRGSGAQPGTQLKGPFEELGNAEGVGRAPLQA
jgi:hypothetical protein